MKRFAFVKYEGHFVLEDLEETDCKPQDPSKVETKNKLFGYPIKCSWSKKDIEWYAYHTQEHSILIETDCYKTKEELPEYFVSKGYVCIVTRTKQDYIWRPVSMDWTDVYFRIVSSKEEAFTPIVPKQQGWLASFLSNKH